MNSMSASVESRIENIVGAADLRVVDENASRFPEEEVSHLADLPGVRHTGGRLGGSLTLVLKDGEKDEFGRDRRLTVGARGAKIDPDDRFMQTDLSSGRLVAAPDEVVIDPLTSRKLGASLGDTLIVQRFGPPIELEVVGILERPLLGAFQKPRVELGLSTLMEAVGGTRKIDVFSIILDDDVDSEAWLEQHADSVQLPLVLEPTERIRSGFDRQVSGARIAFVLAAVIGFLACSVIVATGMTTALAEQLRELAIARLIGAERRQLFLSQIVLGLMISVTGAMIGIPLGMSMAWGLILWFSDFLPAGIHPSWLAIGLSLTGAIGAGVLGSMLPAFLASRVSPMTALVTESRPPRLRGVIRCALLGLGMICVQILLMLIPDTQIRFWMYSFIGMPMLVGGFFLLMPMLCWTLIPVLGPLGERMLRIPRGLLRGGLKTAPYRIGLTAGAMMVGMAILTSTWSHGLSILDSIVERVRFADGFIFKTTGLTDDELARLSGLPGVVAASPVGYLPLRLGEDAQLGVSTFAPKNVICVGFEPESFLELNRIEWVQGTPEEAVPRLRDGDAVLVAEQFLTARNLGVGDRIDLGPEGRETSFEIVGVVGAAGLDVATQIFGIRSLYMEHAVSCVFMDYAAVGRHFNTQEAYILQLVLDENFDEDREAELAEQVSTLAPGAAFNSGRAIKRIVMQVGTTVLGVSSTVALGSLLLACFAVGNIVAAGISAKRYEYGVLRAMGGSRWLVARTIFGEVIVMSVLASLAGMVLGVYLAEIGMSMHRDLAGDELMFILPIPAMALGTIVMIVLALLASTPPVVSLLRRSTRELISAGR